MSARIPLPDAFRSGAWSVAEARRLGYGAGRLRGVDLSRPFRGVRSSDPGAIGAHAYRPLLRPGDRLSGPTAADHLGAALPGWATEAVHVTAGDGLTRPRMRGVVGHAADGRAAIEFDGLPVSPPTEIFIELARILPHPALVAVGDYLVCTPRFGAGARPFTTIADLTAACAEPGRRGIRAARAAADRVRTGVYSPRETALRLLLVDAGLPEPQLDFPVFTADGEFIGWFDGAYPELKVLVEYDGDQHRTSTAQYEKDMRRFELAAEAGWHTVRVRSWGLGPGAPDTVTRTARALRSRGWRP